METKNLKVGRPEDSAPSKDEPKKDAKSETKTEVIIGPKKAKTKSETKQAADTTKSVDQVESQKVTEKPSEKQQPEEIPCTFSRWFRSKGFKPHWQAGMEAYTDVSRRRKPSEWEALFKNY